MVYLGYSTLYMWKEHVFSTFGGKCFINIKYVRVIAGVVEIISDFIKFLIYYFWPFLLQIFWNSAARYIDFYDYLSSWWNDHITLWNGLISGNIFISLKYTLSYISVPTPAMCLWIVHTCILKCCRGHIVGFWSSISSDKLCLLIRCLLHWHLIIIMVDLLLSSYLSVPLQLVPSFLLPCCLVDYLNLLNKSS